MMANKRLDNLNQVFEDHPAIDMDNSYPTTPLRPGAVLRLPSHRSGFAAGTDIESDSDMSSHVPDSPWSPSSWRPPESSSAWYRRQPVQLQDSPITKGSDRYSASIRDDASNRRSASVFDDDMPSPEMIPLPRGGSESPQKELSPEPEGPSRVVSRHASPEKDNGPPEEEEDDAKMANYFRFSLRADVQQRTEPIEQAIRWLRNVYLDVTASKTRLLFSTLGVVFLSMALRFLFSNPATGDRLDLFQVTSLAQGLEPMIHFTENGIHSLSGLQETGTAVWDLAESVRIANFTSAPLIVGELEALVDSLEGLGKELTGFFATVNGDFDHIIYTMEWARRRLNEIDSQPPGLLSAAMGNVYTGLGTVGILSSSNHKDARNVLFESVFGVPTAQHAKRTLHDTFIDILSALEAGVDAELKHAQSLFSLYEAINQQFKNLNRHTVQELDKQELAESETLASLWQRALGSKAKQIRKFEKNKELLGAIRKRTTDNKTSLAKHQQQLQAVKQQMEVLRRHLVKPLLQVEAGGGTHGAGSGWEKQVEELEETSEKLKRVRDMQKAKVMEELYGQGAAKRVDRLEIEGL